jgi:hypothetical protein
LEESQSVALWKEGWEHGSFVVGMLRDCKAVICFGSRVVFDVDVGDEMGDGVGEGDGDEVVMVEKMKMKMKEMNRSGNGGFIVQKNMYLCSYEETTTEECLCLCL